MAPVRHYRPEQMQKAVEAVKKGSNVLRAAEKYGVPRITLRNKITGISPMVCGMGPPSILTKEQENMFVKWLNDMTDRHCLVGKEHLLNSVQQFVIDENIVNPFTNDRPGKKWYYSFLKRHPGVSDRMSANFLKSTDIMTEDKVKLWFEDIEDCLIKNKLQEVIKDPRRIFTSDEAAFYLNPKPKRVLVKRNASNIFSTVGTKKENPRVFLTANAAGQLAPPMVMFADQEVSTEICDSMPEGWGIGTSKTGWMCGATFYEYMTNIFQPWLVESDIDLPIIYFLDGDANHLTLQLSEFCSKHQIELLSLYPNNTEISKPMDVALFRPLRAFWKKECTVWKKDKHDKIIKKENFATILARALKKVTPACIRNGFKVGGLFPFAFKELETAKPDANDINFFNTLEKEIVIAFSRKKIELFNALYVKKQINANDLPREDEALYKIWSKYKEKCKDVIEKSFDTVNTSAHMNLEYEVTADIKRLTEFQGASDIEYDSEGADSGDCEQRRYLSLSEGEEEETTKHLLPNPMKYKLESNVEPLKMTLEQEQTSLISKNPTPRTIRELREHNNRKVKLKLKPKHTINNEYLRSKRKKEAEKDKSIAKFPKILIKNEVETIEKESPTAEYDSTFPFCIKEENEINNSNVIQTQSEQTPTIDIVKKEIEDDSVIIYVTDEDVNILYY